jgi:hypothetical protein
LFIAGSLISLLRVRQSQPGELRDTLSIGLTRELRTLVSEHSEAPRPEPGDARE